MTISVYGDPFSDWPYDKFIDGAKDKAGNFVQFAPKLKSAGGSWDPEEFAQLIEDAGARFAGPVMEHHDGFSMWDSKVNPWNSVDKGPKLNLAKLYVDAFRKHNLKIVAAMHHAYNIAGYFDAAPVQSDPVLKILYGQQTTAQNNQLWYDKLKEVVDEFQPDIVYQDFNLVKVGEKQRLDFLAYYYNKAVDWNKDVVTTYKDGFDSNCSIFDYERGGPAEMTAPYWQTDDAISYQSWDYTTGMKYYAADALLHATFDRVSKGGNVFWNFSPMADGTIPQAQKDLLKAFGSWLKKYGEAIYSTRTWKIYGEGPTKMGGTTGVTKPTAGTRADVRYTRSKSSNRVYAIVLGWPGNGTQVTLASVTTARLALTSQSKVYLFGTAASNSTELRYTQDASGLKVTMPANQPYTAYAYALKISLDGVPPAPPAPITTGLTERSGGDRGNPNHILTGLRLSGGNLAMPLQIPRNTTDIIVYTLSGRVLYRTTVHRNQTSITLSDKVRGTPAETYYVEYLR